MDRLIVLDKGRIVEEGDHRSLLVRGGLYARLWEHQSGGFLGDDATDAADTPVDSAVEVEQAVPAFAPQGHYSERPM
jgi:ATP-binding cassette subfamily B multidrug efflux pump